MAHYRVLIIDDAFFIRNLIKKAIAKKPSTNGNTFEVVGEAQDGRSGIDMCETLKPDIVTVDFNIPTINGLDFAKYLKELYPNIPIIMISSNLDPDFPQKVKAAKCRLLTKPFQEAYLWKILDESVDEILNADVATEKPKVNIEAQKILEELAEEMKGEIVPLKDERKDISSKVLADKNIGTTKAKNVGFDYSGAVLEIKSEKRRMSSDLLVETEKKPEPPAEVIPDIPFAQVDNDVDLEDEDDFIIDLEAVENQRESEYGKTGIEELDDEEFLFIEDDEEEEEKAAPTLNLNVEKTEEPPATLMLDFEKADDSISIEDDEDVFLIDDEDENDDNSAPQMTSAQSQVYEELLSAVTFNYYDYLGGLLYSVQNSNKKEAPQQEQVQTFEPVTQLREETADEEFDRMFKEFNGGMDTPQSSNNQNSGSSQVFVNTQKDETILNRDREHISIDPPKDDVIFKVYGSKLANVTSADNMSQYMPQQDPQTFNEKPKGFFARLLDKLFRRK